MEQKPTRNEADTLPVIPNPKATPAQSFEKQSKGSLFPEQIPEAQGDLADRANVEIDQELQEHIQHAREHIDPARQHYKEESY